MNLITVTCLRCQKEPVVVPERQAFMGGVCDSCIEVEQLERKSREAVAALDAKWALICPLAYRNTEFDRLPMQELSKKAMRWPCMLNDLSNLRTPWMGLNLWGFPRTGKTRTLFLVLKQAHYGGKRIKVFGPSQFAQECEMRD